LKGVDLDNQHKLIKGYRDLSQVEIDLINKIKVKGLELQVLCDEVGTYLCDQYEGHGMSGDEYLVQRAHLSASNPLSWQTQARSDFQVALMKLTRAVAQPTTF
jgi:hypothetical protein